MENIGIKHFQTKETLHTEVLQQKYGPIHAVVLRHDNVQESKMGVERIREANLCDQKGISRTYALTFLTYDKNNKELSVIDDEIRNGGLIGETFKSRGYVVKKNVLDVFIISIPDWMKKDFQTDENNAKARLTEFYAKKEGSSPVIYGNVLEIYTPNFKDPKDGINDIDKKQINPLTGALLSVGVPSDEIWEKLDRAGEDNEWEDFKERYEQADKLSKPAVEALHKKILNYLNSKS